MGEQESRAIFDQRILTQHAHTVQFHAGVQLREESKIIFLWIFSLSVFAHLTPKFTSKQLLLKFSELNSVESEIALRNFLFLGRLISETKMAPVVRKLFDTGAKSFIDTSIDSLGVLRSICDALKEYDLFSSFDQWFIDSYFRTYFTWKTIVHRKIREFEANAWDTFITDHPDLYVVQACLERHLLASFSLFRNSSLIWSAVFILRLD